MESKKLYPKSVRDCYADLGVKQYYQDNGENYLNPHEQRVHNTIKLALKKWNPSTSRVLDLACGSGEVTLILNQFGIKNIDAIDPYTYKAYEKRTNFKCKPFSFQDITAGALNDEKYSLIICSYALHLAEESILPVLCMQMALIAEDLIILSPHKRPILKAEWGWILKDEIIVERTHAKYYKSNMYYIDETKL